MTWLAVAGVASPEGVARGAEPDLWHRQWQRQRQRCEGRAVGGGARWHLLRRCDSRLRPAARERCPAQADLPAEAGRDPLTCGGAGGGA